MVIDDKLQEKVLLKQQNLLMVKKIWKITKIIITLMSTAAVWTTFFLHISGNSLIVISSIGIHIE